MASQSSRSQRQRRAPVRLADEQFEEARRRRAAAGGRQRNDTSHPHGSDEGVELEVDAEVEVGDIHPEDGEDGEVGGGEDDIEENDEGYDSFIEERSRPGTPEPDPAVQRDADGWNLIAKLGPTASFLSSFPALQEVPDQHEQAWVETFSKVLRKWREANTVLETILALSWFLFLPQALLRRPTRGGRAGRKEVARRFNFVALGDWGGVVELWEKDKIFQTTERERRRRREPRAEREDDQERRRREVVALISAGQISRAMSRVTSHGLASMEDAAVMAQVAAKYPPRGRSLPARVPKGQPVEHLRGLRDCLKALQPGSSPGCGGMRPEFLRVLGDYMEEEDMVILEEFGMSYLQGDLPKWFYPLWLSVQTVPIFKNSGRCAVRPLGLRTPLLKVFHKQVVSQNLPEVKAYLEPVQLGMSRGGAQKLVFSIRALLNARPDFICVKIDCRNAYNEQSRRACIDAFADEPSLRHLAHFCAVTLAPVNGLETGGTLWGEAAEGDTQGDSAASMRFCVALHPSLLLLDAGCRAGDCGGMARAGADDITAIGPPEVVFKAVEEFGREVRERCLLHWERTKTEVFTWEGGLPVGTPHGLTLAGEQVDGTFEPGFLMYGVPVGSDAYCKDQLMKIAQGIVSDGQKTAELLSGERQSLWSALRCSISQRFDYWMQMSYPSVIKPVAEWLDDQLWKILECATGLSIPTGATNDTWSCLLAMPVEGRTNRSFQQWVVRLPVRLGGFGLRSLCDTIGPAFIGALEQAVPFFCGNNGICPQLANSLGGEECFGEEAIGDQRWRVMVTSGCREGLELKNVWKTLQKEERQTATWLGRDMHENLSVQVECVGSNSCDGSTRGKISEERDMSWSNLISKSLEVHPNQHRTNRPIWAWLQRDKLSSSWLQALPGPDASLSSAEFSEAAAAALCLPSPACMERLGTIIRGRQVVDPFGETVQSTITTGDHYRKRHDAFKMRLFQMCLWAGLDAEVEIFNLFAASIPQEGLNRMERGRKVQSIVPDMRITIPVEGNLVPRLHELKIISSSKTRYLPRRQGQEAVRAVDKRAQELNGEYIAKARSTDRQYCGTPEGTIGPVESKLGRLGDVKGVVVGAFGEGSDDLHALIHHLASSRVRVAGPQKGKRGQVRSEEAELALTTAFLRRTLSLVGVRAQARLLLGRLEVIGPGAAAAAGRRNFAVQQERVWANQRRADALSRLQGRALLRRGHFKSN